MKKVHELKEGDYIAFYYDYNKGVISRKDATESTQIMVSNITSVHLTSVLVHFNYGHHSVGEYVKHEDVVAIGNVEGTGKIKGFRGNFDMIDYPTKPYFVVEYGTNQTVWVHASDGSTVGRFSKKYGVDIHTSVSEQMAGASQCLNCTHGVPTEEDYTTFYEFARDKWDVEIDYTKF